MKYTRMKNGYGLFWEDNGVGGRRYISDEIGNGVLVWDTSLVEESTLLAAILQEKILQREEIIQRRKESGLKN